MTSALHKKFPIYLRALLFGGILLGTFAAAPRAQAGLDYIFLSINGDTTLSTMTQGDELGWGSNCDTGATVNWEIWYDVNSNSSIETATDILLNSENITDGSGLTEPDPILDGWSIGPSFNLTGEPGNYIFRATDVVTDVSVEKTATMVAMPSPPNQLTGQISLPGISAPNGLLANNVVFAESEVTIGLAVTDDMGSYSLNIGASGTGVEFYIRPTNVSGFVSPEGMVATASGVVTGNDFLYVAATDSVWGFVKDELGAVLNFETVVSAESESSWRDATTRNGRYAIYFSAADGGEWGIQLDSRVSPVFLSPEQFLFDLDTVTSFQHDIILTSADTMIYARITENGGFPVNNYRVNAYSFALGAWSEAVSGTGEDNIVPLGVSSLDASDWTVSISEWDDEMPIPFGMIVENGSATGVSPGDTVSLNLINGYMVSGTITQDPEDAPINWDDVYVQVGSWGATAGSGGEYSVYAATGLHSIWVWTDTAHHYITDPLWRDVMVTGDTTAGLDFTINKAHCQVSGTLINVPLPLDGSYYQVQARTGIDGSDGYLVTADVDSVTGNYSMNLSDGEWTIVPPCCFYDLNVPDSVVITIGEIPDTERTVDFDYALSSCCAGVRGNANSDGEDKVNIADVTFLIDYLFGIPTGPEPACRDEGNANADGEDKVNIADVTYLMDYLFGIPLGPSPPACP